MTHRPMRDVLRFARRISRVRASWEMHLEAEPDISTEQLLARVSDDTGEDYGDVAALYCGKEPGE